MTSSDAERAALRRSTGGEPYVDFDGGSTPYIDYQNLLELFALQTPNTESPSELMFYMIGQVKEMLFKLLYETVRHARDLLDRDDVEQAIAVLVRVRRIEDLLIGTWDVLGTLSPLEFATFRDQLGAASGFQSYMYRMVEFVLGRKVERLARPHRGVPDVNEQVQRALEEPSLYDAALGLLARRGVRIPPEVLERDPRIEHTADPAVEEAWAEVYRNGGELFRLGEALIDVAEGFGRWRAHHLLIVERTIGTKDGTGGTAGVAWLRRIAEHRFFPELWSVRSVL